MKPRGCGWKHAQQPWNWRIDSPVTGESHSMWTMTSPTMAGFLLKNKIRCDLPLPRLNCISSSWCWIYCTLACWISLSRMNELARSEFAHNSLASCSSAWLYIRSCCWRCNCTLVSGFAFELLFWLNCVEVNCVVLNLSFLTVITVVCASLVRGGDNVDWDEVDLVVSWMRLKINVLCILISWRFRRIRGRRMMMLACQEVLNSCQTTSVPWSGWSSSTNAPLGWNGFAGLRIVTTCNVRANNAIPHKASVTRLILLLHIRNMNRCQNYVSHDINTLCYSRWGNKMHLWASWWIHINTIIDSHGSWYTWLHGSLLGPTR